MIRKTERSSMCRRTASSRLPRHVSQSSLPRILHTHARSFSLSLIIYIFYLTLPFSENLGFFPLLLRGLAICTVISVVHGFIKILQLYEQFYLLLRLSNCIFCYLFAHFITDENELLLASEGKIFVQAIYKRVVIEQIRGVSYLSDPSNINRRD